MLLENKHRQAGLPPNSLCPSRVTRVEATASSAGSSDSSRALCSFDQGLQCGPTIRTFPGSCACRSLS
ncbi:hypothetical protein CC1G_15721 [Coprinopsis cinerea okayama7|uniref:Uncharacterized protein n=1 Tax=Coprinopsis cinerea (strain Okayama-7 / 130 / ATCC MYA-4618 / FGSC 9003) TaxID=240176 RepID=D6RQI2_COPC7|nr:hypothetical protein CC1G_15721 [Coprinopsis cinerea okayama7\|eukprot:XP_002910292.1 hypothetical protein CC1G_15721 [Coprinopsis cinerea okayama7\